MGFGKSEIKIIVGSIVFLILAAISYKLYFAGQTSISQNQILRPYPSQVQPLAVHSGDGTAQLIMRKASQKDGSVLYSFFTANASGKIERTLFTKNIPTSDAMVIPANTWSPDNKYVFLRENNSNSFSIFVFKASGETFSNKEQYLDLTSLFDQRNLPYAVADVTGWDSETLLHMHTTAKEKNSRGPSYWFDVTDRALLQLANL
ncbi:MAG: hypothetical protein Q7R31_00340 [Candidatus Levybacteria bacterium]|nr:hypothetical protein [Candidatus Levybacteria bacterium]